MSDAPRKVRRRFGLLPLFLFALAAAGWCAWWFIAAGRIDQGLDEQATALRARGYEVSWDERRLGGFPFRFHVRMTNARFAEPGGWGLSAPVLEAQAAAYAPTVVVFVAKDGVTLSRPDGRDFRITGEAIRASVGGFSRNPPRVSVEGVDLAIASTTGAAPAFTAIERFEAHVRPTDGDQAEVRLSVENAAPNPETILGRVASGQPVSVRLAGIASDASALKGKGWPGVMKNWAAAGGVFAISEGGIRTRESMLTLRPSQISADEAGRARGSLSLTLARASEGMIALGAVGAIPEESAAVGAGLAGAAGEGASGFDLTLSFAGGRIFIGPLPLGPAPRLY
jgi:hypothetical protein